MNFLGFAFLICLFQIIDYSFACNGYDAKLISLTNGSNNPTIVVKGAASISLTENCKLYLNGSLNISEDIKCIQISFTAKKNGKLTVLDMKNMDFCTILKSSKSIYTCPLHKGGYSDASKVAIDVTIFKYYLPKICGSITVDATVVTNKKEVNKFTLKAEITKRK